MDYLETRKAQMRSAEELEGHTKDLEDLSELKLKKTIAACAEA